MEYIDKILPVKYWGKRSSYTVGPFDNLVYINQYWDSDMDK